MTIYFWGIKAREWIWELLEELSGARMTHSYVRVGGLAYDLTADFIPKVTALFPKIDTVLKDIYDSLLENRIFRDRMDGTGVITQERAISYGWTGPTLRSTGVDYDVRKAHPYLVYDRFDFDVPVGAKGDNFDRYIVRMEEVRQSVRILEQAFKQIPEGPVCLDDPRIILPPKPAVYNTIEGMICALQDHRRRRQGAARRGLLVHRRRQRRARLLHRLRRDGPTLQVPRARAVLHHHQRPARDDRQPTHRRHRADVRHDEHDRRRV